MGDGSIRETVTCSAGGSGLRSSSRHTVSRRMQRHGARAGRRAVIRSRPSCTCWTAEKRRGTGARWRRTRSGARVGRHITACSRRGARWRWRWPRHGRQMTAAWPWRLSTSYAICRCSRMGRWWRPWRRLDASAQTGPCRIVAVSQTQVVRKCAADTRGDDHDDTDCSMGWWQATSRRRPDSAIFLRAQLLR